MLRHMSSSTFVILMFVAACMLSMRATGQATVPATGPQTYDYSKNTGPLQIGIIGLAHGHVEGLLWQAGKRKDIQIVGIYEPNRELFDRYAKKYDLQPSLYYAQLEQMLDATKPEAVSVMTSIKDHRPAVEACAPRGIHMLLEKPLAFSRDDAQRFEALAKEHKVLILTNFETSWYNSVREAKRLHDSGEWGSLRKMIYRHGHKGPVEIGCQPEFLQWLLDPAENGGGAIVDFGCYGAVLSTWLMDGQRPTKVVASAATLKPTTYKHVDDDATIVLTYPTATAVIQASWAWTHDNKEMDLHSEKGSIHAAKWDELTTRRENSKSQSVKPPARPDHLKDEWVYLKQVVRGQCAIDPLSSLEFNVIVAEILDQARSQLQR